MKPFAAHREMPWLALAQLLHDHAEPLPPPEDAAGFGAHFDRFADARIVLLGAATHGSREFLLARAAITQRLIERHGFTVVAIEADWPDAARMDDYVRHRAPRPGCSDGAARFPAWMWCNQEMLAFADWLHGHNSALPADRRVALRGLDLCAQDQAMNAIVDDLAARDPAAAAAARERYSRLFTWSDAPVAGGHPALRAGHDDCAEDVIARLRARFDRHRAALASAGESGLDPAQHARVLIAAERYYRALYRGAAESDSERARMMFATLQAVLAHGGDHAKAVVWAHNAQIGNAAATAMGWRGGFNLGQVCRMAYGDEVVAIGCGTDRGLVAAASQWGGPVEVNPLGPARTDSWEHASRHAGFARSLTDWRSPARRTLAAGLRRRLPERAIGVVYRPASELLNHYGEAILSEQFDAFVWFDETRPVTPLGAACSCGVSKGWPFVL